MLSLFNPSSVAASTDASSMVPLSVVKEVLQEITETRRKNLEFRQAVSDHESANSQPEVPKVQLVGASRSSGGRSKKGVRQPTNRGDLNLRPPGKSCPNSVPRNVGSVVVWDIVKVRSTGSTSTSAVTELNFSAYLSLHPQATSWQTLFDQWSVPQMSVSIWSQSVGSSIEVHTAIDFDNVNALSSLAAIDDFESAQFASLYGAKIHTRSCKPCMKLSVPGNPYNSSVLGRNWCDCAQATTPWNGLRTIIAPLASTGAIVYEFTIWFAFRNQI